MKIIYSITSAFSLLLLPHAGVEAKSPPSATQTVDRMLNKGGTNYFVLNTAVMAAGLSGQLELLRQEAGKPLWSSDGIILMVRGVMEKALPQIRDSMISHLNGSFDTSAVAALDEDLGKDAATGVLRCAMSVIKPNKETGQPSRLTPDQWSTCESKINHSISTKARATVENVIISAGKALNERSNQLALNKATCAAAMSIITPYREIPMRRQVTLESVKVSLGGVKYSCVEIRDLS